MVTPTYTVVLSRGTCCSRQRSYVRLQWLARTCLLREDQHADRKHKAKMVTPTYTVVLLQIAIMLDPRESQKAPCVRDTKVATRHNRNSTCHRHHAGDNTIG